MLEGFATGSAAMIPTVPAFVPLDDAIRELGACLNNRWSSGSESDSYGRYEQAFSPLED